MYLMNELFMFIWDKVIDFFIPYVYGFTLLLLVPLILVLTVNLCANIGSMPDLAVPKEKPIQIKSNQQSQTKPKTNPMKTGQPTMKVNRSDTKRKQKAGAKRIGQTNKKSVKSNAVPSTKTNIVQVKGDNSANLQIKSSNIASCQKTKGKGINLRACIKPLELTEDNFYEHMKQYILTKEQLWEHKFPRRDPENPKVTIIKDYVPSNSSLKRLCCRCGKEYFMNKKGKYVTRDQCHYHWGKLVKQKGQNSSLFTCCGADASGITCVVDRLHVSNKLGPLANFASTESCRNNNSRRKVFALDCEMCFTTQGLELTRVTAINFKLEQVIDLFVKPSNPIVDYNTRYSGVTQEDLQDVTTNINDIHNILLNMVDKETILLGHSLESDLNALKLIHEVVVDTSVVFPHWRGLPLKRALRNLMAEYMQKVIQSGEGGHDSSEDARSCMNLMKYKFKEDQKLRKNLKHNSSTRC